MAKSSLETQRAKFRAALTQAIQELPNFLTEEIIDETVDEIMGDFVLHRLPPPSSSGIDDGSAKHCSTNRTTASVPPAKALRRIVDDSVILPADPLSVFCMVRELDGVTLLAMSNSKCNSRMRHMGHPLDEEPEEVRIENYASIASATLLRRMITVLFRQ